MDVNLYRTDYKDFLFEKESIIDIQDQYGTFATPLQQVVNVEGANVMGLETKGAVNLDVLSSSMKGFRLLAALGYSKGSVSTGASLVSLQPLKGVLGLDYESEDSTYGLSTRLTHTSAKRPEDTLYHKQVRVGWPPTYKEELKSYKWLSGSSSILDVYGFIKPTDALTVRAGVYNVLNQKYLTWDKIRSANQETAATTSVIDDKGLGLQRFYEPGINYKASVEFQF